MNRRSSSRSTFSAAAGFIRLALASRDRLVARQLADERLEILRLAEVLVDRGEAHIGDGVEAAQPFHDEMADLLGADVALAAALQLAHDAVHHPLDSFRVDSALAQRHLDGAHQLVAVEGHAPAAPLGDHQLAELDPLEGGETAAAIGTDPPPSDGGV